MTQSALQCCTSIIQSSALVQASSSLSIGRTCAWPRRAPVTEMHFRHYSREFIPYFENNAPAISDPGVGVTSLPSTKTLCLGPTAGNTALEHSLSECEISFTRIVSVLQQVRGGILRSSAHTSAVRMRRLAWRLERKVQDLETQHHAPHTPRTPRPQTPRNHGDIDVAKSVGAENSLARAEPAEPLHVLDFARHPNSGPDASGGSLSQANSGVGLHSPHLSHLSCSACAHIGPVMGSDKQIEVVL